MKALLLPYERDIVVVVAWIVEFHHHFREDSFFRNE